MSSVEGSVQLRHSVYKYQPLAYVLSFLDGNILFRNLVYFRKLEHDPRWDIFDGVHVDAPGHDVRLDNLTTGKHVSGRFAFHNTLKNPERIYCFCTSLVFNPTLAKYGDACVEIFDVAEFERRLCRALQRRRRVAPLDSPILQSRPISYYDPTNSAPPSIDIKNPLDLPFAKRTRYSDDVEHRFVFARKRGYVLQQKILIHQREEDESLAAKTENSVILRLGSIRDIARQVS